MLQFGSLIYSNRIDSVYEESLFVRNKFQRSSIEKKQNTTPRKTNQTVLLKESEITKNFEDLCNNFGNIESNLRILSNSEGSSGQTSSLFVNKLPTMKNNSIFELYLDYYDKEDGETIEEYEENIEISNGKNILLKT